MLPLIVGIVVGVVVLIAVILIILFIVLRRRKNSKERPVEMTSLEVVKDQNESSTSFIPPPDVSLISKIGQGLIGEVWKVNLLYF